MKLINQLLFVLVITSVVACSSPKPETTIQTDEEIMADAVRMAQEYIMADGHVDIPYRLMNKMDDISVRTEDGHFDFVRAKEGGLDAPFMSIYVPSSYQETGEAKEFAEKMILLVEKITTDYPEKYAIARSPEEVSELFKNGVIALPLGMENGAPIGNELHLVQHFHDLGIRYITLTHAKDNLICDSSYDPAGTWNGLSPFGYTVVEEMNRVGIMVDVSHVSDSTFYQVLKITKAPVIASHSSCRYFTPGWKRNMSDEMIELLALNGGVIQINFGSDFLDESARKSKKQNQEYLTGWEEEIGDSLSKEEVFAYKNEYHRENYNYSTVSKVADHIDHVVSIAGIDHVAFGSDFDGVGDTLPHGLKDASQYPNVIGELLKRGYTEEDIEKICYLNVFRVWNKSAEVASKLQGS